MTQSSLHAIQLKITRLVCHRWKLYNTTAISTIRSSKCTKAVQHDWDRIASTPANSAASSFSTSSSSHSTPFSSRHRKQRGQATYKFVDRARIQVRGGNGGKGCLSHHRLHNSGYKKRPDGGNGGYGGSVVIVADKLSQTSTLHMSKHHFAAQNGTNGTSNDKHGRRGKNVILRVPCGVVVRKILDDNNVDRDTSWENSDHDDNNYDDDQDEEVDENNYPNKSDFVFDKFSHAENYHSNDNVNSDDDDDDDDFWNEDCSNQKDEQNETSTQATTSNFSINKKETNFNSSSPSSSSSFFSERYHLYRHHGEGQFTNTHNPKNNAIENNKEEEEEEEKQPEIQRKVITLADLDKAGSYIVVASGGKGGCGNHIFAKRQYNPQAIRRHASGNSNSDRYYDSGAGDSSISSGDDNEIDYFNRNATKPVNTSMAIAGEHGESVHLELELKLIADIGLVGFPNAGKSSLLAAMSRAKPEIAPYPFTTLHPNVGCIEYRDGFRVIAADVPGLIEGASIGRGRGYDFLRHLERTKSLLYIVDAAGVDERNPVNDFKVLVHELSEYGNGDMLYRPSILVANKVDLITDHHVRDSILLDLGVAADEAGIRCGDVVPISAGMTGEGLTMLSKSIRSVVTEGDAERLVSEAG